jgi:hypothetical protein
MSNKIKLSALETLFGWFRASKIRKTKEAIAYWAARADIWRQLCAGNHMSYERDYFVEAHAEQKKYEARLAYLESLDKIKSMEKEPPYEDGDNTWSPGDE